MTASEIAKDVAEPSAIISSAMAVRGANTPEALLFNYVLNNGVPKERHVGSLMRAFKAAVDLGHAAWPLELKALCQGKDVLDFGCGATLYGVAFRALGARSYTGIDKILEPDNKKFRSRTLKKSVNINISLSDIARIMPGTTYMRADDVTSQDAFDIILVQSVTHLIQDLDVTLQHFHRALRPGGEIWILHENFYSWAGHQGDPRSPQAYDGTNPEHQQLADWGHVLFDPPPGHRLHSTLNRVRPMELRRKLDRYFEVNQWKEVPDRSSVLARLTPERRKALASFNDQELLTKQIVGRARRRT